MSKDEAPPTTAARPRGLKRWLGPSLGRATRAQAAPAAPPPESLFGALVGGDSQVGDEETRAAKKASRDKHEGATHERTDDARPPQRPVTSTRVTDAAAHASTLPRDAKTESGSSRDDQRAPESPSSRAPKARARTLGAEIDNPRLFRLFLAARAALGLALFAALAASGWFGAQSPLMMTLVALVYAGQAIALWLFSQWSDVLGPLPTQPHRLTRWQWMATIGVDLLAFTLLLWMQPSLNLNVAALLLMPVLMGGVMASRRAAMAGTAWVVLMLLANAWRGVVYHGEPMTLWLQTGLAGMGFFAVTLVAGEMSSRLAREESAARSGLELARQQAQLNRLVIEQMAEGVLVVDRNQRVRAANPAARRLLARNDLSPMAPFDLRDDGAWAELQQATLQAFERKAWPQGEMNVPLKFADGTTRTLRLRAKFTRRRLWDAQREAGAFDQFTEAYAVLFLEDLREVHDRTRQEKLAAMGRVSAGIAHEIRNPLAAIAQANALLEEEAQGREQQMLTRMIGENVERLKLIVDDVMAVAPAGQGDRPSIDAVHVVGAIVADWARASQLAVGATTRLRVSIEPDTLPVTFDPEHLRRVLVNLLDNARRYASDTPGAITLNLRRSSREQGVLSVASDGEPIAADVEPYLFEPFFSTRSRGTGLGLYICRELCERYGASIDYWPHPSGSRHRNEFRVVFRTTDPTNDFAESRLLS